MTLVNTAYVILLGLNLCILIFKWYRHGLVIPFKILFAILAFAIALELGEAVLFKHLPNNLFLYHIYNPLEFTLYSLYFINLSMSPRISRIIFAGMPVFLLCSFVCSIFIQTLQVNNSFVVLSESVILIFYGLLYLRFINVYQIERRAEGNPYFWVTLGILLYFTGSLFIEGFLNLLMNVGEDVARQYYKLGFVFKYLMCILFLIGILKRNPFAST